MTPTEIADSELEPIAPKPAEDKPAAPKPQKAQKAPINRGPGRPPAAQTNAKKATDTIGFGLTLLDGAAAFLFPKAWITPDDRLTPEEVDRLLKPTYAVLAAHPKWATAVVSIGEKSEYVALFAAAGMVALPRMIRHNLLPPQIGLVMAQAMGLEVPAPAAEPAGV